MQFSREGQDIVFIVGEYDLILGLLSLETWFGRTCAWRQDESLRMCPRMISVGASVVCFRRRCASPRRHRVGICSVRRSEVIGEAGFKQGSSSICAFNNAEKKLQAVACGNDFHLWGRMIV